MRYLFLVLTHKIFVEYIEDQVYNLKKRNTVVGSRSREWCSGDPLFFPIALSGNIMFLSTWLVINYFKF